MNNNYILILLFSLVLFSCGNKESDAPKQENTLLPKAEIDTTMVLSAFDHIKSTAEFKASFFYDKDVQYSLFAGERPILIGDVNGDGKLDALMPFAIQALESTGTLDEYDKEAKLYYAIFLNKNGQLVWLNNFSRALPNSDKSITFEVLDAFFIKGNLSKSSYDKEKEIAFFKWDENNSDHFVQVRKNNYYWNYEGIKLNGKYALNTNKSTIVKLFTQPDSISSYFRECNAGGGPKELYHYGSLLLEFNEEKNLDNDNYNFDNKQDYFLSFNEIRLDKQTRYEDILKLSPEILKQQPEFEEEETEQDHTIKTIYIPLKKIFDYDEYYNRNWIILNFKSNKLIQASIPSENCEI